MKTRNAPLRSTTTMPSEMVWRMGSRARVRARTEAWLMTGRYEPIPGSPSVRSLAVGMDVVSPEGKGLDHVLRHGERRACVHAVGQPVSRILMARFTNAVPPMNI